MDVIFRRYDDDVIEKRQSSSDNELNTGVVYSELNIVPVTSSPSLYFVKLRSSTIAPVARVLSDCKMFRSLS